jgi:septal ring factor EnvC (AmiA/AmiB activator)
MAVACQVSDPTRLRELEGEVKDLTMKLADVRLTLAQIKAEKGALEAENARLRTSLAQTESQLTSVSADLAAKSQSLAVAGMQVEAAQVTTDELRQDRAMWSSLFMSTTTSFDANKFQSLFMGSLMRDPSKKADGGAGGSS